MANWTTLKAAIADVIKTNGNQEITGAVLQNVLTNMVNSVGENATFVGVATPTTNPGTPDGPVFYLATKAGTYSNFGGIVVNDEEACILQYKDNYWVKTITELVPQSKTKTIQAQIVSIIKQSYSLYNELGILTPYAEKNGVILNNSYVDYKVDGASYLMYNVSRLQGEKLYVKAPDLLLGGVKPCAFFSSLKEFNATTFIASYGDFYGYAGTLVVPSNASALIINLSKNASNYYIGTLPSRNLAQSLTELEDKVSTGFRVLPKCVQINSNNIYNELKNSGVFCLTENIKLDHTKLELDSNDGKYYLTIQDGSVIDMNGYSMSWDDYKEGFKINGTVTFLHRGYEKKLFYNLGFKGGNIKFNSPIKISSLLPNDSRPSYSVSRVVKLINTIIDSTIILDIDANATTGGVEDTIILNIKNNIIGTDRTKILFAGGNINIAKGVEIKNCALKSYYALNIVCEEGVHLENVSIKSASTIKLNGGNSVLDKVDTIGNIEIISDRNIIRNCSIDVTAKTSGGRPISISGSDNIIENNICKGGVTSIIMFGAVNPSVALPYIKNNIIRNNICMGCTEEAISMDQAGNADKYKNRFEFLGFKDNTNPKVILARFVENPSDYSNYIGFPLFGISEATIGTITFVEDIAPESENTYAVTLKDNIFDKFTADSGSSYYPFNEAEAINEGYKDYSNSLFAIGFCFIGNIIENNNVFNGNIDIYGAGFFNSIRNNINTSADGMSLYLISNSKNKYINKVAILPICKNIITGNICNNGGIYTEQSFTLGDINISDSNKDERITSSYIRQNIITNNISKSIYFSDSYQSLLDGSMTTAKHFNPPYSYNYEGLKKMGNITPLYFVEIEENTSAEDSKVLKDILLNRDKCVIFKDSTGYKIYVGKNRGAYNKEPIFDILE